jgi:alpha-L-fucosidase
MTPYLPTLPSLKAHPVPDWFHDAKFGIMFHWSLSSIPGWATPVGPLPEVIKEKGIEYWFSHNPYAEWYWNTLKIAGSPTREYHVKTFGDSFQYPDFAAMFNKNAQKWDPDSWADLIARVGARYSVVVTKHHDGFQLWPSRNRNPFRPDFCSERDIVGELTEAVRRRGLRMGLYYSGGPDWWFETRPVTGVVSMAANIPQTPEYVAYVDAQWRELIERYQPAVLWNDIGFPAKLDIKKLYADYYNQVPEGVVNDRCLQADVTGLAKSRLGRYILRKLIERLLTSQAKGGIGKNIHADFTTPEYAAMGQSTDYKWESVRGIGYSFGYNQNETAEHMLSVEQLVHMLADIVSKNGNLLLNLGPMADGSIPELQRERVEGLGRWLKVNGEAIYGTRPWAAAEGRTADGIPVRCTAKEGSLYAILLGTPAGREVQLPGLRFAPETKASLLGEKRAVAVNVENSLLTCPAPFPASPAHVLKLSPAPARVE